VVPTYLRGTPLQRITAVLTILLGLRYFVWRFGDTLNPEARVLSYVFLAAEVIGFVEVTLFLVTTWRRTKYRQYPALEDRSVDVFIATYNEPVELLRDTAVCAVSMRYPHRTYLLDDGNRPEVAALARELGCDYLARTDRTGAKAGNLNHALRHTTGEFVVTLDADHVPAPDLIEKLLGLFADADVAAVQSNQDFYNLDSFQHETDWVRRSAWQQQELFFNVIQPGKDSANAAYYCGSPAMLRRSALEEIGGFPEETITEDMHTSLRLQKRGYRTIYVNRTVARGLAPHTYDAYQGQWRRWGIGAMQVFRLENPLFCRGLSFMQRVNYLASTYFYWTGLQKCVYLLLPGLCLMLGVFPLATRVPLFLSYFAPYLIVSLIASASLQGGFRGFWRTEQFNLVKIVSQLESIRGFLPRRYTFAVTPKSRAAAAGWRGVWLYLLILLTLAVGLITGARELWLVRGGDRFWAYAVTMGFALYYMALATPAVLRAIRQREMRVLYRFPRELDLQVQFRAHVAGAPLTRCAFARNLNRFGLSLTLGSALPRHTTVDLEIPLPDRVVRARGSVAWTESFEVAGKPRVATGIRFDQIDIADQDAIARYLFWEVAPKHGNLFTLTRQEQAAAGAVR
jgi:cellulose synthase (UDP-forming)